MPGWSDDTYDPNETRWARLDPTRGVPYDDDDADWSEQPTQPQPVIRPDDRYQRSSSAPAPFWPQEQRPPARDPLAEAARDRRRLVWGGLAVGAILLAATLAPLTQLGLPGSHTTVAPIQAGPHTTLLPTATAKPTATPTPRPTATPIPSPTPMPSPTQAPSPTPALSPTPLPPTPAPLPTAAATGRRDHATST